MEIEGREAYSNGLCLTYTESSVRSDLGDGLQSMGGLLEGFFFFKWKCSLCSMSLISL